MATKDIDPRTGTQVSSQSDLQRDAQTASSQTKEVPPVTADVDETPAFIRYGAAVLLGLAFGVGCYVWYGEGNPYNAPKYQAKTIEAPSTGTLYAHSIIPQSQNIPAPFAELGADWTTIPQGTQLSGSAAPNTTSESAASQTIPDAVYLFSYDSSKVPESAELNALASRAGKEGVRIDVRAYTDEHGKLAYNQRLSERRAKAIGDYLAAHGVPASKIVTKGMGPTHKYTDDAHDRRAEVRLIR